MVCNAINPDTGDQCQKAMGHPGYHKLARAWKTPYRMAEPENVGAVVVSGGFRLARIWEVGRNWADLRTGKQYRWVSITNPEPFQNCALTADDPEPPIGSVVLDRDGGMWQRLSLDWCLAGLDDTRGWNGLRAVGPVTLLYRGEA